MFCLQWEGSNERQLKIRNVDFAASGYYSCSASMEQPIYTKFSEKVELTVFGELKAENLTETLETLLK